MVLLAALHGCMLQPNFPHSGTPNSFCMTFAFTTPRRFNRRTRRNTMNIRALPGWKPTSLSNVRDLSHPDIPARRLPVPVSRRQFARTAAGSALAAAVGSRFFTPSLVQAASFAPVPIPGGTPALGGAYHVFGQHQNRQCGTFAVHEFGHEIHAGRVPWHGRESSPRRFCLCLSRCLFARSGRSDS